MQTKLSSATVKKGGQKIENEAQSQMPLSRINFIMMIVCGLLIVLGFVLMAGGATTTDSFNPDIFSTRRVIIGPGISFIGFVLMAFAILYRKPSETKAE